VAGLLAGGAMLAVLRPSLFAPTPRPPWVAFPAGLLVGLGTAISNGCTSGHGVCGLSRFSKRSFVATVTSMGIAAIAVFVYRHVLGAG
jgi:uncharacterized membrane protein YedE/YeeE